MLRHTCICVWCSGLKVSPYVLSGKQQKHLHAELCGCGAKKGKNVSNALVGRNTAFSRPPSSRYPSPGPYNPQDDSFHNKIRHVEYIQYAPGISQHHEGEQDKILRTIPVEMPVTCLTLRRWFVFGTPLCCASSASTIRTQFLSLCCRRPLEIFT